MLFLSLSIKITSLFPFCYFFEWKIEFVSEEIADERVVNSLSISTYSNLKFVSYHDGEFVPYLREIELFFFFFI